MDETSQLNINLETNLKDHLKDLAKREGLTLAAMVKILIRTGLKHYQLRERVVQVPTKINPEPDPKRRRPAPGPNLAGLPRATQSDGFVI